MSNNKSGFTLVEVAIVLVIVGLLVGGVIKGRELITNARISSTISEIKNTEASIRNFRDKYREYPGDMKTATTRLRDCTPSNFCINGNGDAAVGNATSGPALGVIVSDQAETVQVWKHLALSDMISGIDVSANYRNPRKGVTNPEVSIESAALEFFFVSTATMIGGSKPGHYLRMTSNVLDGTVSDADVGAVSPLIASQIERKMDDGKVASGKVLVWDFGDQGCDNALDGTSLSSGDETIEKNTCVLLFRYK